MDVTWDDEDPEQVEKVRALNLTNDWATYGDLDRRENGNGEDKAEERR